MNFLYRTAEPVVPELPLIPEQDHHKDALQKSATTLEGLIADDPYQPSVSIEDGASNNGVGEIGGDAMSLDSRSPVPQGKHTDVLDDEGWITIPKEELPENWNDISDMVQLQPLDRSFLFPGEQVHILACLSASKQDMQVISPFRIAAVMSKNGNSLQHSTNKSSPVSENGDANGTDGENGSQGVEDNMQCVELNDEISPSKKDISETASLLHMEDHKQQIENMLQRFKKSNFFVRIAESDEPLWSKKRGAATKMVEEQSYSDSQGNSKVSGNSKMRQHSHGNPNDFEGWAALLWRMQRYLYATERQSPIFHVRALTFHGRLHDWKAWVYLEPLPLRPDVRRKFVAYRRKEADAIQDVAKKAVEYLRHYYDDEYDESPFHLIPQENEDGTGLLVQNPDLEEDPRMREIASVVSIQEEMYARMMEENKKMHLRLHSAQTEIKMLKMNLERCQHRARDEASRCGETSRGPAKTFKKKEGTTAPQGRLFIRGATSCAPQPPKGAINDAKGKEPMVDDDEEEDPEPEEWLSSGGSSPDGQKKKA